MGGWYCLQLEAPWGWGAVGPGRAGRQLGAARRGPGTNSWLGSKTKGHGRRQVPGGACMGGWQWRGSRLRGRRGGRHILYRQAGRRGSSWGWQWSGGGSSMRVWLARCYSIPELSSTSSCNLAGSSHQGLLRHAMQVHRGAGGHTSHMLCSGHQGRLSHRGVGC